MKKVIYLCLVGISGLLSCNSNNSIEQTPVVVEQETSGSISFKYKGALYSSNYEVDGKNCRYDNPEIIKTLNELQEIPNLALLAKSDGTYEYFDSYEELCENEKINNGTDATTRAHLPGMSKSTLKIYTRTKYRGDSKAFTISVDSPVCIISDLGTYGLDEQITSMRIEGAEFYNSPAVTGTSSATFFENKNRKGRSGTFTITYPYITLGVKDFANFSVGLPPRLPFCMDDQTSSILFTLGTPMVPEPK